ncbi:SURF1 family protein [Neptunomonas qingdaonensis]|uniref:SURF1-like protein n=1 Tax=Neptunomonas qingdaonensis TaxID=1045558 RepID=A0A1I2M4G3_9GAMM|nr:SURF1 family protein [Neptunomonas qingdaonensis]SFF85738.1 Cytochrome oxidase assembly protein ShyY1 [Neptunomonas qingdaonensis]
MSNLQCGYINSKDRQRNLFKWILALQAVLICSLLLFLGNWQLQRAAEKEQLLLQFTQAEVKQNSSATPIHLFDKVELSGHLITDHYFFLDNRTWQGQVGYEVIAALKTNQANIQLISLGWLAAPSDRNRLPSLTLPNSALNVIAYADKPSKALLLGDDTWTQSWPKRIQQLDLHKISSALKTPVSEWLFRPVSQVIPELTLTWKPVVLPPQRHTGYAVQWYGLATAWLICSAILARKMFINKESSV